MGTLSQDEVEILRDHLETIEDSLGQIKRAFRKVGGITWERAKAYPLGAVEMALSDDHEYLGKNPFTIKGLIDSLDCDEDEDEDED